MYDPRREERRKLTRVAVPEDVDPRDLDAEVRQDLRALSKDTADLVARHLVMTGRLLDEDPQQALAHARAAGALAGRVGSVREAVGLAAYAAEEWADALSELRAARRITGRADHLAVMADCERALGRPERALALAEDPDVPRLEQAVRVELAIVVAGARRDMGQADAAVVLLQTPARATTARRPWAARLWYAYADALLAAGRADEARQWFAKAAEHDGQGETDAMDRLLDLDGVLIDDLLEDESADVGDATPEPEPVDLDALLRAPVAVESPPQVDRESVTGEGIPREPDVQAAAVDSPSGRPAFSDEASEPASQLEVQEERPRGTSGVPAVAFAPPPESQEGEEE